MTWRATASRPGRLAVRATPRMAGSASWEGKSGGGGLVGGTRVGGVGVTIPGEQWPADWAWPGSGPPSGAQAWPGEGGRGAGGRPTSVRATARLSWRALVRAVTSSSLERLLGEDS